MQAAITGDINDAIRKSVNKDILKNLPELVEF
jgi:hypothetical protein